MEALIIDIQKYSIHDGEGIRTTVFFKGCPLSCLWCHNPESRSFKSELLYNSEKCTLCLSCIPVCPNNRIYLDETAGRLKLLPGCTACAACAETCLNGAREIAGKVLTVADLMKELDKDAMFYEQSGGGITLSGGEVMAANIDYVQELLRQCQERGYSVNIDTCGYAPFANFERILKYIDIFLYDIKVIDPEKHKQYTGCDNQLILNNLVKLSNSRAKFYIRLPLIEGINCSDADIDSVLELIKPLSIQRVYLLPYHNIGRHKAQRLGVDLPNTFAPPNKDRLRELKERFEQHGYLTIIGG